MKSSLTPRLATRVLRFSPRTIRQIPAAVSVALLLAIGVMTFALLVQHWKSMSDVAPSPGAVDDERHIDFLGRDAEAWSDYWLTVAQAAGIG